MAAWILSLIGMYDMAKEFHGRAESLPGKLDDAARGWRGAATMFVCKYIYRDPWKANLGAFEAESRFARIGDARLLTLAHVLRGSTLCDLGAYEEAKVVLEEALETSTRSQIHAPRGDAKRWLGHALEGMGRYEEALAFEEEAENQVTLTLIYRGSARASRGWLLSELGRHEEGAERLRLALDDLVFAPTHRAQALAWLSRIEGRRGRRPQALQAARDAEQLLLGIGTLGAGESAIHVALVEALEAIGEQGEARTKLLRGRAMLFERAAKVTEERYKRCLLERVPESRWLLSHEVK